MAKMGRPKVENPSTNRITVRFTDKEYNSIRNYAKAHKTTMTKVIKEAVNLQCKDF